MFMCMCLHIKWTAVISKFYLCVFTSWLQFFWWFQKSPVTSLVKGNKCSFWHLVPHWVWYIILITDVGPWDTFNLVRKQYASISLEFIDLTCLNLLFYKSSFNTINIFWGQFIFSSAKNPNKAPWSCLISRSLMSHHRLLNAWTCVIIRLNSLHFSTTGEFMSCQAVQTKSDGKIIKINLHVSNLPHADQYPAETTHSPGHWQYSPGWGRRIDRWGQTGRGWPGSLRGLQPRTPGSDGHSLLGNPKLRKEVQDSTFSVHQPRMNFILNRYEKNLCTETEKSCLEIAS